MNSARCCPKPALAVEPSMKVGARRLAFSNLEKPLYPTGFTKRDVIEYYLRVAPAILPHLKDRAVTLKRYPNGSMTIFLREKLSRTSPALGQDGRNPRQQRFCNELLFARRPGQPFVGREPGRTGTSRSAGQGRASGPADGDGVPTWTRVRPLRLATADSRAIVATRGTQPATWRRRSS